ncbi:hypothetical protein N9S59_01050 [Pseudomonadota bacterium]|nr:hypothetical protein [Pseudomonadota bacterium]
MKKLLPLIFVLILSSCSKEVPSSQLVERNGLTYELNSQEPFNGISVEYEGNELREKLTFKKGKLSGPFERYYSGGSLESKGEYVQEDFSDVGGDSGETVNGGLYEEYFVNGQLRMKGFLNPRTGEFDLDKEFIFFYSDGGMEQRNTPQSSSITYIEWFNPQGELVEGCVNFTNDESVDLSLCKDLN